MEQKRTELLRTSDLSFMDMITYPDISIEKNSTVFIKGKSGTGKSTLLKLFSGLENPGGGSIFYDGTDIETLDTIELRRDILLVPQSFYLFDGSIRDNYREYYKYREQEMISDDEIKEYLKICMMDSNLGQDGIDQNVVSMSGGERQRVFISICLSFKPAVIMLDEPTSALDESNAKTMLKNIREFADNNDMTIIVVSHDDTLSENIADQIITLSERINR